MNCRQSENSREKGKLYSGVKISAMCVSIVTKAAIYSLLSKDKTSN